MTAAARHTSALLVVDVQNDFCTGGALAVPHSEDVIAALNHHLAAATARGLPVYASRDWHPAVTTHFKSYGGVWPTHCVQHSEGARFHPELRLPPAATVVTKGDRADEAGYSALEGRTEAGHSLVADLRNRGITHLFVGGLATDYCVRASVLDALAAGFDVTVLSNAIAGVDVNAGDSARALDSMQSHGAQLATNL
jgi:nicotinamidase/pyrazinamidase